MGILDRLAHSLNVPRRVLKDGASVGCISNSDPDTITGPQSVVDCQLGQSQISSSIPLNSI
jgi:hypothetical protein